MIKYKFIFFMVFMLFLTGKAVAETSENDSIALPETTLNDIQDSKALEIAINDSQCCIDKTCVCSRCNITGFYIGLNAGGAINRSKAHIRPGGRFFIRPTEADAIHYYANFNNGGFIGGPQIGYQYQHKLFFCALETDFNYSSLKKTVSVTRVCTLPVVGNITYRVSHKINWIGTLRPKIGVYFNPVAIYATGGLAYCHIQSHTYLYYDIDFGEYNGSLKKAKTGWTVGGGLAYNFARHWFVDLSYLFLDFGKNSYTDISTEFSDYYQFTDLKTKVHNIKLGLSYLF